ncbi:Zinc-binding domain of primase-helicase family [Yersinia pseudotuberculosis]|nr:Zinc-binding domain of primase-helicase family [Yersinia pseudotuberculosis]
MLWLEYSARSPEYCEAYTENKWVSFAAERSSYRGVFYESQKLGWENEATKRAAERLQPRIETRDSGLYLVTPKVNKQTGEIEESAVWMCSPLDVIGRGTDGAEEYIILSWKCNCRKVVEAIPLCDIGERDGWRRMKAGGLNVTTKNNLRAVLGDYLQLHGDATRWNVAKTTGWQYGAYIMPDGEIIGMPSKPVIFCGHSATAQGYTVKGTVESWRDNVALLVAGNPSMVTAVAAAFAAPMLALVGADGFGIHFYEQSSAGKTTTANTAASLYGSPDKTKLTWYGTALGMVNEAVAHNDGFMALDEISQNTRRRDVAESAYALFNGVGKLQGRKEGGNRDILRFTTVALSTGETDLESFIREDGGTVNAGQLVRLLNIPLTKAAEYHTLPGGKAHADALKAAYQNHYGAVGRKWVGMLGDAPKKAQEAVATAKQRWKDVIPAQGSEQAGRVADCFAILEAALMLSLPLTGWKASDCQAAIEHTFKNWLGIYGTGNRERVQLVEMVENFLLVNESRFDLILGDGSGWSTDKAKRAGWLAPNSAPDGRNIYYVLPGVFKAEVIPGKEPLNAVKLLHEEGALLKKDKRSFQTLTPRVSGHQHRTYALMLVPIVEDEDPEESPEIATI